MSWEMIMLKKYHVPSSRFPLNEPITFLVTLKSYFISLKPGLAESFVIFSMQHEKDNFTQDITHARSD